MTTSGTRRCVWCGGQANSREHIFKKDFKKTLGITEPLPRAFSGVNNQGARTTRPDPLFELKVRRVCRKCNSGWMNRLDLHVEPWILDTGNQTAWYACDPIKFRRWAIKLAMMRSLVDNASAVPRDHFHRLYNGDDLEEWHVFVGRAHFKEFRHAFSHYGINSVIKPAGAPDPPGWIHGSWALGTAVISAICITGRGWRSARGRRCALRPPDSRRCAGSSRASSRRTRCIRGSRRA